MIVEGRRRAGPFHFRTLTPMKVAFAVEERRRQLHVAARLDASP